MITMLILQCQAKQFGIKSFVIEDKNKIQEIDKDSLSNAFFGAGYHSLHMAENHKGDVCVSDFNARIVDAFENEERV